MTPETANPDSPNTLGDTIDALFDNREQRRALEATLTALKKRAAELEAALMQTMEDLNLSSAKSKQASATVNIETVPSVTDWDALCRYIQDNDAFYLLTRKIKTPQYRELLQAGSPPPGVEPFTRKSLNLRTL